MSAGRQYEREQGVDEIPLRLEEVSGDTSDANAYATGLGPSRRVVLWDTLLDGRFSDRAEKVVLAHEIGHHSSRHLPKGLAWFAMFALPAAWILMRLTRRRGGMRAPEAVPLALLVVAVIQLVAAPLQSAISRSMEKEADWKALTSTQRPRGREGAVRRLLGDRARRSEPADLAAPPARQPPDARRARRVRGGMGGAKPRGPAVDGEDRRSGAGV